MNTVRVIQPGMMTTVQDLGRSGQSSVGVARGGAADALSLRVGNRLVGNADGAAGLEMTVVGGVFEFERAAVVSVTGAVVNVEVMGASGKPNRTVPWASAFAVEPGECVHVGTARRGVRAYLCLAGGVDVDLCLGSRSTSMAGGFGGVEGRPLRAGDVLGIGNDVGAVTADTGRAAALLENSLFGDGLRACTVGGSGVDPRAAERFWSTAFAVASNSDRMGVRLQGTLDGGGAPSGAAGRMISEGMMHGAVQVPQSGMPIVLGVEHPTTGGYPIIACVAAVDLPALGQCGPGRVIRFVKIDHAAARTALVEFEARLNVEVPGR